MTYLQWRINTKSKPIKIIDHRVKCAYIHFQEVDYVEDALEAAYRAGLRQGRKDASHTTK